MCINSDSIRIEGSSVSVCKFMLFHGEKSQSMIQFTCDWKIVLGLVNYMVITDYGYS
jgi:hypothetical protein